jgi:hypothetical protein
MIRRRLTVIIEASGMLSDAFDLSPPLVFE